MSLRALCVVLLALVDRSVVACENYSDVRGLVLESGSAAKHLFAGGRTWFLSTLADERGLGTRESPFQNIEQFLAKRGPGDVLLVQEGVYRVKGRKQDGVFVSGANERMVGIIGEPGKRVIFDLSDVQGESNIYGVRVKGSCWYFENLEITGVQQRSPSSNSTGFSVEDSNHIVLNRIASYRNGGPGIKVYGNSQNVLVHECVSYCNIDEKTALRSGGEDRGENADGFSFNFGGAGYGPLEAIRNLALLNSDDGFDLWETNYSVVLDSNLAVANGYDCQGVPAGDGNGFKLGRNDAKVLQKLHGNTAILNKRYGFDENGARSSFLLLRNLSFGNGIAAGGGPTSLEFSLVQGNDSQFHTDQVFYCSSNYFSAVNGDCGRAIDEELRIRRDRLIACVEDKLFVSPVESIGSCLSSVVHNSKR